MRINKYVAQATGMSRRRADAVLYAGRIEVNGVPATNGQDVKTEDIVSFDGRIIKVSPEHITLILNKPRGFVCSRDGQGSKTIYELIPSELHKLKPVGRLDKDSSGLLLMTTDGELANQLTHPSFGKQKMYTVRLAEALKPDDAQKIRSGITLSDGLSTLKLKGEAKNWVVTMSEGRNRQIRRTFSALGYEILQLHRTRFGTFELGDDLGSGKYQII